MTESSLESGNHLVCYCGHFPLIAVFWCDSKHRLLLSEYFPTVKFYCIRAKFPLT